MAKISRLLPILCLCLITVACGHTALAEDLQKLYEQMHAGNRIDAKGQEPFYIKIAAQIYDLDGKASDTATIEEWWEAGRYRIEVNKPGGREIQTSAPDSPRLSATRTSFLLRLLLDESVNPLNNVTSELSFTAVSRSVGALKLRCLSANWARYTGAAPQGVYCTLPDSTDLLMVINDPISVVMRNQIAHFHDVSVALKTTRLYLGRAAVSGEVKALRGFDAKTSEWSEFRAGSQGSDETEVRPGSLVSGPSMDLPIPAGQQANSGVAFVIASISPTGSVVSPEVIASSSSMIAASALRTVPQWKYTPWRRDGKPVEGHTTMFINPSHR